MILACLDIIIYSLMMYGGTFNYINLSLGGIQRPLRKGELPDNAVEVFRFGDFGGWVIEA